MIKHTFFGTFSCENFVAIVRNIVFKIFAFEEEPPLKMRFLKCALVNKTTPNKNRNKITENKKLEIE